MMRPILQHPHPSLRMKCSPVSDFGEVKVIVGVMHAAINQPFQAKCLGLAANQVGILKRVIVVEQGGQWITMVNPVITDQQGQQTISDGCMSVDYGRTFRRRTRPKFIRVEYFDEQGNHCRRKAKGINAAVIAHECDHLDGILFIDEPAVA
jgi:peptide deformylase